MALNKINQKKIKILVGEKVLRNIMAYSLKNLSRYTCTSKTQSKRCENNFSHFLNLQYKYLQEAKKSSQSGNK